MKTTTVHWCPGCNSNTEKNEGCNHMTCTVCKYQWCWLCGREYTSDHYSSINPLTWCVGIEAGESLLKNTCMYFWLAIFWPVIVILFCLLYFFISPFKRANDFPCGEFLCLCTYCLYGSSSADCDCGILLLLIFKLPISLATGAIAGVVIGVVGWPFAIIYLILYKIPFQMYYRATQRNF